MNCNCPNGSYGKKHTQVCITEAYIERDALKDKVTWLESEVARLNSLVQSQENVRKADALFQAIPTL